MHDTRLLGTGDWLTFKAAAQRLGVTYWRLYRFVRANNIPTAWLGHTRLVRLSSLRGLV